MKNMGKTGRRTRGSAGGVSSRRLVIRVLVVSALLVLMSATTAMAHPIGLWDPALRSVPAGAWTSETSGTASDLGAVSCVNSADAWASGADGTLLRTTDGGSTWTRLATPITADQFIQGVSFVSPTVGWAIGRANSIIKSTDGGVHWSFSSFLGCPSP